MLYVCELAEKVSVISVATRPMKLEDSDTLADSQVTFRKQQCWHMIFDLYAQFLDLTEDRKLIKPGNDYSHGEDTWRLSVLFCYICLVSIVWVGAAAHCRVYFLVFSLFNHYINSTDWLLKAFHALRQELFDLWIFSQKLWFGGVFDALKQNMYI